MSTDEQTAPRRIDTRLTIRDVATAAGVSPATVSRALRGLGNVDERTRSRIVSIARDLNYSVSPAASRLASGRAGTIGIVTPYVGRWYFTEVFAGIEERLKPHDVDLLIHTTEDMETLDAPAAAARMRRRVDGALVIGMSLQSRIVAELATFGFPVVLLGATGAGLSSVSIDDRAGARTAVGHLVDTGHERIAVLTGRDLPTPIMPENDRFDGYLDVMAAHELPVDASMRAIGQFTAGGGEQAMAALLERRNPPTAVFSMSDEMAYGAMRALTRAGLRAGGCRERGEVAVVGFDGHDLADAFDLTTVVQPVRDLGRCAADLLMEQVLTDRDPAPEQVVLPTHLAIRGSTGCPAALHEEVRTVTDP